MHLPTPAGARRRSPYSLFGLLAALLFVGCQDAPGPTPPTRPSDLQQSDDGKLVTVMTRNLYVGTTYGPLLSGSVSIPEGVRLALADIDATNFPERAEALANEIAAHDPALVGVQEAALIRFQQPGDNLTSTPTPATQARYDYLALLLKALADRGRKYTAVAVIQNFDLELPSFTFDARVTDRDVILARSDVMITAAESHRFAATCVLPLTGVPGGIPLYHGWVAVNAKISGQELRFVSTHLDGDCLAVTSAIQVAQMNELLNALAKRPTPTVLVGDLNSRHDGSTTPSYANALAAGFADAWDAANPADPGLTYGHAPDLRNPAPLPTQRIDYILTRGRWSVENATIVGTDPANRTPSGLWPSDHFGMVATLRWDD